MTLFAMIIGRRIHLFPYLCKVIIWQLLLVFAILSILMLNKQVISVAYAATITVNSLDDTVANDGQCTLREAIIAANTDTASGA